MNKNITLPPDVAKKVDDWFSCDYNVIWGWGVNLNGLYRYYLIVYQYDSFSFMKVMQRRDKSGYDIGLDQKIQNRKLGVKEPVI